MGCLAYPVCPLLYRTASCHWSSGSGSSGSSSNSSSCSSSSRGMSMGNTRFKMATVMGMVSSANSASSAGVGTYPVCMY